LARTSSKARPALHDNRWWKERGIHAASAFSYSMVLEIFQRLLSAQGEVA
jgi:hypothetical protein